MHLKTYLKNLDSVDKVVKETAKIQMDPPGTASGTFGGATSTTGGTTPSKAADAITGGGKNIKQIYINIDNLVGVNNNMFTKGDDPKDATSFMEKLTNALQMIVNDTNYATN